MKFEGEKSSKLAKFQKKEKACHILDYRALASM